MRINGPARILHLHSSFNLGGKEARAVQLMNAFGAAASHTVLSAMPEAMGAAKMVQDDVDVVYPGQTQAPVLYGKPSPFRYLKLARYFQKFDLLLSYNWGSMDAVGAHRLFSPFIPLPPLIHHEDGFNEDEREKRNWKRDAFRRLMLPTAHRLMVPSATLEQVARAGWHVPPEKLIRFSNGIRVTDYAAPSAPPPFAKQDGDIWVGTLAGLRTVKNLPALVRAVAAAANPRIHLLIAGEGPEKGAIIAEAERLGMAARLHMLGFCPRPADIVPHFDIFALSSYSEQQPISLMEAMASGLPACSYAVGDTAHMIAPENADCIVQPLDEAALSAALRRLAGDKALRVQIGRANRAKALAEFDEAVMIKKFRQIYGGALKRPDFALQAETDRLAKV